MATSRLIVKNLPKSVTESSLRELFSRSGAVTDVQLKFTPDGKFRSFAFIGFKSPDEAEGAISYFNNTYIGATKINVESCVKLGDPSKPKAWSKHATEKANADSNKLKRKLESKSEDGEGEEDGPEKKPSKKKTTEAQILEKCQQDPDFLEFLESHRQKSAWGNDTIVDELEKRQNVATSKSTAHEESSLELDEDAENSLANELDEQQPSESKKDKKKKKSKTVTDDPSDSEIEQTTKKSKKKKGTEAEISIDKGKSNDKKAKARPKKIPEIKYFTIKLRDLPEKAKKRDVKAFFSPFVPKSIRLPPRVRGIAYVGFATEEDQKKAMSKNKSFLMGNKISIRKYELPENIQAPIDEKQSKWTAQEVELEKESETIGESGRIFIRNLSYLTNEDEIRALFEPYGPITEVHLPIDRLTRKIKGFGFISFLLPEHAAKSFSELDGTIFQGRMLHLLPSKIREEAPEDSSNSYKKNKDIKQKKNAGSSHNWNTLFLGPNAVTEVVSNKYGVSREEFLLDNQTKDGSKQSSVAVRMALGESEIVDDTRKFLEENGVSLAAFEKKATERSKTCILVKNLTSKTSAKDLVELFSKHGEIGRLVLPPSGITAIVEFMEPAEARAAFKKLAYTKFENLPLFLEWAPVDTFAQLKSKLEAEKPKSEEKILEAEGEKLVEKDEKDMGTKLLVRNVPFQATIDEIKDLFSTFGELRAARLPLKFDGSGQHRGFAFVEFHLTHEAARAFETLGKSTHLYGRRLVLDWAAKNETVDELRQKTAKQFNLQKSGQNDVAAKGSTKKLMTRYFQTKLTKTTNEDDEGEN